MKKGRFCVLDSEVQFTSFGSEHVAEHENRALKMLGGI